MIDIKKFDDVINEFIEVSIMADELVKRGCEDFLNMSEEDKKFNTWFDDLLYTGFMVLKCDDSRINMWFDIRKDVNVDDNEEYYMFIKELQERDIFEDLICSSNLDLEILASELVALGYQNILNFRNLYERIARGFLKVVDKNGENFITIYFKDLSFEYDGFYLSLDGFVEIEDIIRGEKND